MLMLHTFSNCNDLKSWFFPPENFGGVYTIPVCGLKNWCLYALVEPSDSPPPSKDAGVQPPFAVQARFAAAVESIPDKKSIVLETEL